MHRMVMCQCEDDNGKVSFVYYEIQFIEWYAKQRRWCIYAMHAHVPSMNMSQQKQEQILKPLNRLLALNEGSAQYSA